MRSHKHEACLAFSRAQRAFCAKSCAALCQMLLHVPAAFVQTAARSALREGARGRPDSEHSLECLTLMKRQGLVVDSQTLWDQLNALIGHVAMDAP
jgi:hypothetical protein